jgi:restriction system protein
VPSHPFLTPILAHWPFLFGGLVFLLILKFLASPTFKGWFGEAMVNRGLRSLDPSQYRHFHDLYLPHPTEPGTTQIDHILVSPFGIFVIETKNYRGWIFGSENQRQWTQQIYRHKHRFQNPLHQNRLHVRALMHFLALPEDRFLPVVFFIGHSELKTPMPPNVLNHGLIPWIRRHTAPLIDPATAQKAIAQLDHLHRTTHRKSAARAHLAALRARHQRPNP